MINSFALAAGISPDTVWDRQHIYKACLVEEMMRGLGSAGEFRVATAAESEEYRWRSLASANRISTRSWAGIGLG